jgi:hypothetical protein
MQGERGMNNGITLTGAKEVEMAFKMLGDKAGRRILRSVAQAGASQMKKEVIARAPKSKINRVKVFAGHKYESLKKHLRQSIKTTVVKAKEADVKILVHTGDAFWGRFLEQGAKAHDIKAKKGGMLATPFGPRRKVRHPGINASHWMQSAFEASEQRVRDGMEQKLVDAIIREAGKGVG